MTFATWPADGETLIPAVVQHAETLQVLMLAYMNREAYERTHDLGLVTFFSRSRQRLWTKGETSRNTLQVVDMVFDCDQDTLLVSALPAGPACHLDTTSCFGDCTAPGVGFVAQLDAVIRRRSNADPTDSYTARLISQGVNRIAQKVGEEAVETVIAGVAGDATGLAEESADLVYHLLVLLRALNVPLEDVLAVLRRRHSGVQGA